MPTAIKRSESCEIEPARALIDHVRAAAADAVADSKNASVTVPGRSFCARVAAGSPWGLGNWLLREGRARRDHGSRGLVVPINGRYGGGA